MRNPILYLFLLFSISLYSQTSTLEIKVTNIKELKGNIHIGLYKDPDHFPKVNKEYKKYVLKVTDKEITKLIKIPDGKYAISVYHDKNSDNICNQNKLQIPLEAFGFSNNVVPFFAVPTFGQCSFKSENGKKLSIRLIQPIVSE
ncbi:MAG: DUF2141 domain-containing protein [Crocinitomicaceae bacterium]|nr:DUF2141 domain-containing protein [Crocinitomicaceae bacterium]